MADETDIPEPPAPITPAYTGPKPGDRPLPTAPAVDKDGNLRDLDKEREAREAIIRHDSGDDNN
jgi:hypothetical protein